MVVIVVLDVVVVLVDVEVVYNTYLVSVWVELVVDH